MKRVFVGRSRKRVTIAMHLAVHTMYIVAVAAFFSELTLVSNAPSDGR